MRPCPGNGGPRKSTAPRIGRRGPSLASVPHGGACAHECHRAGVARVPRPPGCGASERRSPHMIENIWSADQNHALQAERVVIQGMPAIPAEPEHPAARRPVPGSPSCESHRVTPRAPGSPPDIPVPFRHARSVGRPARASGRNGHRGGGRRWPRHPSKWSDPRCHMWAASCERVSATGSESRHQHPQPGRLQRPPSNGRRGRQVQRGDDGR